MEYIIFTVNANVIIKIMFLKINWNLKITTSANKLIKTKKQKKILSFNLNWKNKK